MARGKWYWYIYIYILKHVLAGVHLTVHLTTHFSWFFSSPLLHHWSLIFSSDLVSNGLSYILVHISKEGYFYSFSYFTSYFVEIFRDQYCFCHSFLLYITTTFFVRDRYSPLPSLYGLRKYPLFPVHLVTSLRFFLPPPNYILLSYMSLLSKLRLFLPKKRQVIWIFAKPSQPMPRPPVYGFQSLSISSMLCCAFYRLHHVRWILCPL